MAEIKKYFTIINNVRIDDLGRGYVDDGQKFMEYNFYPSVTVQKVARHYEGNDSRTLYLAISDDTSTTTFADGTIGTVLDYMLQYGLRNYNCEELTSGVSGTALTMFKYMSPARTDNLSDGDNVFSEAIWNDTTKEIEQTLTFTPN